MNNKFSKNKGITLIALVITIIILLILAGVTIAQLTENGLFEKAKIAKMKSEYTAAKEIIEIKLMEVQAECIENSKEYTIVEIAKNIKEDNQITIEKYYNSDSAIIKTEVTENLINLNGIVVSVDRYSEYKFLIGTSCKIDGIIMQEITDTIALEDFSNPEEFEKEVLGKVPSNNNGNEGNGNNNDKVEEPKEEIKDIPAVGEDVDTTNPIEIQTYMLISKNSKNTLNLTGVENATYTVQEKTSNVSLSGNILTANNNADSKDSCKIQITGTYNGQSYTNNLTVYVELEKTTVKDEEGNDHDAYAIDTKDDLLRAKDIIENIDNNSNFKLINNIELNSSEQYEFDENGKITFKETAQKYTSIGSTDKPYGGIFDGNEKEIIGLYIDEENLKATGLIARISQEGKINKLTIKNSYLTGTRTGGICGNNEGRIYRCKFVNSRIIEKDFYAGGISAANNGEIIECATIESYIYGSDVGGIVGVNGTNDSRFGFTHNKTLGNIYRCYSTGDISYAYCSGIAASNGSFGGEGYIYDCYSLANIKDNKIYGSIVAAQSYQGVGGYLYNSYYLNAECDFSNVVTPQFYGTVENSYSNDTTVTAEKLNGETGTAWVNDTENINNGYPILKWQIQL